MLKKIVKYGNSNALVLDKALLELLNMSEGSVVKIKTDGTSLIITPQNVLVQETISPTLTVEDTLNGAIMKVLEQSFGDSEKACAYHTALKEISNRRMIIMKKMMDTPKLRQEMEAIQKRFANDETNPEYDKQIRRIQQQYLPEWECLNQDAYALAKKYTPMDSQDFDLYTAEFAKVHEKYRHVAQAVAALNADPEYIHEMMLIAEKLQINKDSTNSKEYLEAHAQLISKNIPEYAVYQEELKKVAERFNKQAEQIKELV